MKRPTAASLKKVNAENLASLGIERLTEILLAVADARPEVKRRLRMELAAEQGPEHLWLEIDKRLNTLQASRSKVSWRQRPTFVRDLDGLRVLIAERLAALDQAAALNRIWTFMGLSRRVGSRVKDRDGELAAVFARAAGNIGALVGGLAPGQAAEGLVDAMTANPPAWAEWLPLVLAKAPAGLAGDALRQISERDGATPGWMPVIRQLADAADDIGAYSATFTPAAMRTPANAALVAQRLLAAGRVDEAGKTLEAARAAHPDGKVWGAKAAPELDFDWETAWIDYLAQSGREDEAQALRWASFERTLSVERARAFTRGLTDFADVEAETEAFAVAARHADVRRALDFLMEWPAVAEAGRLIQARADAVTVTDEQAELWAAKLRVRNPAAANILLRKAAAAAFRRRDFKTSERLTAEADAILG